MRLIDADALIDKTDDRYSLGEIGRRERDDIVNALEYAPTITAQPRTGHWVEFPNHNAYKCSECGRIIETADGKNNVYKHYPYCHCGAKMLKEGETHD